MISNKYLAITAFLTVLSISFVLNPKEASASFSISYSSGGHHGYHYKYGYHDSHYKHKHRKHYKKNHRKHYKHKHKYTYHKPHYNHYNSYSYKRNYHPHKIYKLPRYADFVWVGGNRYYYFDGVYYQPSSCGTFYTFVDTPYEKVRINKTQHVYEDDFNQEDEGSDFVVHLKDRKGDLVEVKIKKSVHGYIGPQGEYYPEFPKVAQLKAMYTK